MPSTGLETPFQNLSLDLITKFLQDNPPRRRDENIAQKFDQILGKETTNEDDLIFQLPTLRVLPKGLAVQEKAIFRKGHMKRALEILMEKHRLYVGGPKGIGKSTLVYTLACYLIESNRPVVYVVRTSVHLSFLTLTFSPTVLLGVKKTNPLRAYSFFDKPMRVALAYWKRTLSSLKRNRT